MPDAIGHRLNALPQQISNRACIWTILRQQIVQKDDGGGHLSDLAGFLIEGAFRGRNQQTQHKRGQCADQTSCHFYNVPGVWLQVMF